MGNDLSSKRRSLWDIGADFATLDELLDTTGGELTAELEAWFAQLGEDLTEKVDGYAAFVGMLEARARVRKEEADRLLKLASVDTNAARRLKLRLLDFFQQRGLARLDTRRYVVSVAGNGGAAPLDIDPRQLPSDLVRTHTEPDVELIRKRLEAGPVPGVTVLSRGHHLRIK